MNWAASEAVAVLTFLLPGFVSAAVFYSLTSHPKPNEFGRVIQALIFTIVVQAVAKGILLTGSLIRAGALWTKEWEVVVAVLIAVPIALITVYVTNNDTLHKVFRWIHLTKETSYPSEWYSAFSENRGCYVVLHLSGERRLYGWPEEWPSRPDEGHFRIAEGEWLTEVGQCPMEGVSAIVVPARDVEMVEFLQLLPPEDATD